VAELDAAIAACEGRPILVAHSLGCMLVAQWAQWARAGSTLKIAGAFLVAPSDVEAPSYPVPVNGFAPTPMGQLPFPSMVVASTNDEYATVERSRAFAQAWGSKLVEIGDAGHVNTDTGYGQWPKDERMLEEFCFRLQP
jgi:predicted alpha/beta hydrolase family esterase